VTRDVDDFEAQLRAMLQWPPGCSPSTMTQPREFSVAPAWPQVYETLEAHLNQSLSDFITNRFLMKPWREAMFDERLSLYWGVRRYLQYRVELLLQQSPTSSLSSSAPSTSPLLETTLSTTTIARSSLNGFITQLNDLSNATAAINHYLFHLV